MREVLRKSRALRRLVRWYRGRSAADPGWGSILKHEPRKWRDALEKARGGPKVLVATSMGGYWAGTTVESLLAAALTLRGANAQVLLCDGVLPACQACEVRAFAGVKQFARKGPQGLLCPGCFGPGRKLYERLGFKVHRFSDHITKEEEAFAERASAEVPFEEIERLQLDGAAVGEQALAGALRFFARGDLEGEPGAEPVLRRYLRAAILTYHAAKRILGAEEWRCAVFHHGIYVPQGLIGVAARQAGVRVVNWNPAYRKRCFIFSHGDTYHHTLIDEPVSEWERIPWGAEREEEILAYLKSRWRGTGDWIWFQKEPVEDLEAAARSLGLDLARPYVGLLTNVIWDAQLHYPRSAFRGMTDWMLATVRQLADRPDLQLVIRIHPAEVHGTLPSRQGALGELRSAFPRLPPNVIVVPPDNRLSTYALMSRANAALIYGTKTGVELAAMGIPVIVAGEAWVRGKGFTHDARSEEDYSELLEKLPFAGPMRPADVERARKYAYHFFMRRMIPLDCMEPMTGNPPYTLRLGSFDELESGRMRGLDVILDGILKGTPFVYPAEELAAPRTAQVAAAVRAR